MRESGIPRDDIFVTTKVWLSDFGYKNAKKVQATARRLPHISISSRNNLACNTHLHAYHNRPSAAALAQHEQHT